MNKWIILSLIGLSACGSLNPEPLQIEAKDGANGENGQDGQNGSNGLNGKSLVSQARIATSLECPSSAGSAVDIYVDNDNSGTVSLGDSFQSGLVACNGINGQNAVANTTGYDFTNTTACIDLGEGFSGKKSSSSSNSVRLYIGATCAGSTLNELSEGGDEIFSPSASVLFILEGANSGLMAPLVIRKVKYNI
jgi:hypothetical protein